MLKERDDETGGKAEKKLRLIHLSSRQSSEKDEVGEKMCFGCLCIGASEDRPERVRGEGRLIQIYKLSGISLLEGARTHISFSTTPVTPWRRRAAQFPSCAFQVLHQPFMPSV